MFGLLPPPVHFPYDIPEAHKMNRATILHAVCIILFINTVVDFYAWLSPFLSPIAWAMTSLNMITLLITLATVRGKL